MAVLEFLAIIIGILVVFFILVLLTTTLRYMLWFNCKFCHNCKHRMDYKGLVENDNQNYYLFYCRKCGSWEQIPKDSFFRYLSDCK